MAYPFATQFSSSSSSPAHSPRPSLVTRLSSSNNSSRASLFALGASHDQPSTPNSNHAFTQQFDRLDVNDDEGDYSDADNANNNRKGQGSSTSKVWSRNRNRSNPALPNIFTRSRANSSSSTPPASRPPTQRSFSASSIGSSMTGVGSKIKSTFTSSPSRDVGIGSDYVGSEGSSSKTRSRNGSLLQNLPSVPSPKMPWRRDSGKQKGSDFISLETEAMRALEREQYDREREDVRNHRDDFDDLENDDGRQTSDDDRRQSGRRHRSSSNPFASPNDYSSASSQASARFPSTFVHDPTPARLRATSPQQHRSKPGQHPDADPNRRERERDQALARQRADSGRSESERGLGIAIALYDFASQEPNDLPFSKNASITIISKADEEWWQGRIGPKIGMFPRCYVEVYLN